MNDEAVGTWFWLEDLLPVLRSHSLPTKDESVATPQEMTGCTI